MADLKIDVLGAKDLPVVADLYNAVYKPRREKAFFERRFLGRHNALILIAQIAGRPVGFFVGMELKPSTFFEWLYGVAADHRRAGIGSQLMEAANAWAKEQGYVSTRLECHNQHRAMLHLAISHEYDILGLRWDPDRQQNLVIFEKQLAEAEE